MKRILKEKRSNRVFQYITKHIGKGVRSSLNILYIKDEQNQIVKTVTKRVDIKQAIIKHNRKHFQIVYQILVYNNKIYEQLEVDKIRDKIL